MANHLVSGISHSITIISLSVQRSSLTTCPKHIHVVFATHDSDVILCSCFRASRDYLFAPYTTVSSFFSSTISKMHHRPFSLLFSWCSIPLHAHSRTGRGGGRGGSPPIRAVCRHEFGQRVDIIRAKPNRCLKNTNSGSVPVVNEKKSTN